MQLGLTWPDLEKVTICKSEDINIKLANLEATPARNYNQPTH